MWRFQASQKPVSGSGHQNCEVRSWKPGNFSYIFLSLFFLQPQLHLVTIRFPFPIITNSLPFCVERNFYTKYLIVYSDSLGENKFCLFEKTYYYSAVYNLLRFRDMFGQHIVRTL